MRVRVSIDRKIKYFDRFLDCLRVYWDSQKLYELLNLEVYNNSMISEDQKWRFYLFPFTCRDPYRPFTYRIPLIYFFVFQMLVHTRSKLWKPVYALFQCLSSFIPCIILFSYGLLHFGFSSPFCDYFSLKLGWTASHI